MGRSGARCLPVLHLTVLVVAGGAAIGLVRGIAPLAAWGRGGRGRGGVPGARGLMRPCVVPRALVVLRCHVRMGFGPSVHGQMPCRGSGLRTERRMARHAAADLSACPGKRDDPATGAACIDGVASPRSGPDAGWIRRLSVRLVTIGTDLCVGCPTIPSPHDPSRSPHHHARG